MRAPIAAGMIALVTSMALAGCTTSTAGTATPVDSPSAESTAPSDSTSPESSPGSEADTYGAPRVDTPLDASDILASPCSALTQDQLVGFGVQRTGEPDTDSEIAKHVGPGCIWSQAEVNSSISVDWESSIGAGLANTYRQHDQRPLPYFEETTVENYPAVFNDQVDSRAQGTCNVTVGVSDTLAFDAMEQGRLDAQGACDRAKQVAAAVIRNLRGNQ